MNITRRLLAMGGAVAILATACTSGGSPVTPTPSTLPFARGGTLRITAFEWDIAAFDVASPDGLAYYALDPTAAAFNTDWMELFRCCLTRTLMSYNGTPTAEGGGDPQPDLAAGYPTVSRDGLTWTFRLRRGIHYAPPMRATEVQAQDFVRALQRALSPGHFPNEEGSGYLPLERRFDRLFWVIQGAKDYEQGRATTIAGVEAPDPHRLVFHLTQPTGDLPYRLALPSTAPIPASPADPAAPFGVATGHSDGYGPFLVASGPYMIAGADRIDETRAAAQQTGASGYVPGISLTLVRNPSWAPATDPLRIAYADRIELTLDTVGDAGHAREAQDFRAGRIDIGYFSEGAFGPTDPLLATYEADPTLRPRLHIYPSDYLNWIAMNMAMPPFDDIHVRKAVNLIVDKRAVQALNSGHLESDPTNHIAFDSLEDNLLLSYDPYRTPDARGDLGAAEAEIRRSAYDHDGDGTCDDPVCRKIVVLVGGYDYARKLFAILRKDLAKIGLHLATKMVEGETYFGTVRAPSSAFPPLRDPLVLDEGASKDFPSGADLFGRAFLGTASTGGIDQSLIGATPAELEAWGYGTRSVPDVSDRVHACERLVGSGQPRCWANLDQYLMEEVVPWVPLLVHNRQRLVSERVVSFAYDQLTTLPALDRIALRPGTQPAPSPTPTVGPVPAIPDGTYRMAITAADFRRSHGSNDPDGLRESTGTFTITVRKGHFIMVASGGGPYFAPIAIGRYTGRGDTVRFVTDLPSFNVLATPPMRWTFDGAALHLTFLSCEGLVESGNPTFCNDQRTFYEAHPWVKIG